MKTCLIYGHDGLDLDVTYNLEYFYRKQGFSVFFSGTIYDADLLVVTRAKDSLLDMAGLNFGLIHVYDYTGWDYDAFINSVDHSRTFIFTTFPGRKSQLQKLGFPAEQIYIALPPVVTALWIKKLKVIRYKLVHIGNFKHIDGSDNVRVRFNEAVEYFKVNVWGSGWNSQGVYNGKAALFRVSSIYSKSEYALGLMYPFQRQTTFSGRFWQAPLNGCTLFSEKGFYTQKIPGIIETDYSPEDLDVKIAVKADRQKVRDESIIFWNEQYQLTLGYVKPTLDRFEKSSSSLSRYLIFLYNRFYNILIRSYQRSGLSVLIAGK